MVRFEARRPTLKVHSIILWDFVLDCIERRILAQNKNFDYEYNVASILKTLQLGLHHEELYLEL